MSYYDIKLNNVLKYLQNKGWQINEYSDLAYKITLTSKGEDFDIIIPKKEKTLDYGFRIEQLIHSLSSIEERDANVIFQEIENMGFDILGFRFIAEDYEGTLPLNNFTNAVEKIYGMIKFEACSELNPQSQYTNTYDDARDLLKYCEVPQTEKGSYIINIKVPLGETYMKEIKKEYEYLRFLGRNTIARLIAGINEAKDTNLTNERHFRETYDKKLNRNTCKIISDLIDDFKNAKIEINAKWDVSKPISDVSNTAKLSERDKDIFKTMENYLKRIPEYEEKIIKGKIIDMKRSKDNEREQTIVIYDGDFNRNVYVKLKENDYENACNL